MDENKRAIQLHFYVTEKENETIKERMKESGIINLSHYLRKMAISGNIIHLDMTDIKNVSMLLNSCSNNLNQFVRLHIRQEEYLRNGYKRSGGAADRSRQAVQRKTKGLC